MKRAFALGAVAAVLTGCNGGTVDDHALKRDARGVAASPIGAALDEIQ